MSNLYNIYCDESCHLENDNSNVMVLGAMKCNIKYTKMLNKEIMKIKEKHKVLGTEIKWTKVSTSKLDFYIDLVNFFFDSPVLSFRGVVAPHKDKLRHKDFNQTHDDWYYRMYYFLLRELVDAYDHNSYKIYLDIKDTNSYPKVEKLRDVLNCYLYDFEGTITRKIQLVRSHEINILQLADLFIGAICYKNRELVTSEAKLEVINSIVKRTGYSLTSSTSRYEQKFNIFVWEPRRNLEGMSHESM